jgi:hypothetical protein
MRTSTSPTIVPSDFPEWLDSMVVKEFRQAMRQRMFIVPFAVVHFLMIGALALEWQSLQENGTTSWLGRNAFWLVAYVVVGFIMPLRGFEAMQEESGGRNADTLIIAGLSRWRIVRGKWMVQAGLAMLVLVSLLPYFIVRYFFGAFDLWINVVQLLNVFSCCLATSALIIGASGYTNYTVRILISAVSVLYAIASSVALTVVLSEQAFTSGNAMKLAIFGVIVLFGLGFMAICVLLGLQLARAHLKVYLVPWEPSPTRTMVTLILCLPFILGAGTVATCGWGGPLVEMVLIYSLLMYDRDPSRDKPGKPLVPPAA